MGGSTRRSTAPRAAPSVASRRRAEERAAERRQRMVVGGAVAVVAVVAAIIVAGLLTTQYLPPRAHVLTVGDREHDAAAVARRASYYAIFEGGLSGADFAGIAVRAVGLLIDEHVLGARAPLLVGAVSEADLEAELRARLGLDEAASRESYAQALTDLLRRSGLRRDELESLVTAQVLAERMREHLGAGIGDTAPQLRLSRVRLAGAEAAAAVRERAVQGEEFAALALEVSLDTASRENGGDLGWSLVELLDAEVAVAVDGLEAGGLSAVVASGAFFDVYLVAERQEDRALDEAQRARLLARRIDDWFAGEVATVPVQRDLSAGEEEWIVDRVFADIGALQGR